MNQFIHVNSYGLTAPKKAKKDIANSVGSVVGEANRTAGNHPHVKNPESPILHYGKPIEVLERTCEEWAASMTDAKGRKLRKDALCLVAGVVSAPAEIGEGWEAFRDDAIEWLKRKYGDRLETILEHTDEDQPHLHFYVVPKLGCRFETIHQGREASDAIKGPKQQQTKETAYKAAMQRYQDDFSEAVGLKHGMNRLGVGAPRVSRAEAMKRKETRTIIANQLVREVKVAVERGERRGFAKGKADGVVQGEAQGIEQAKAEFEKRSLFAKLTDFIKGLTKENKELRKKLETAESSNESLSNKFESLKAKAVGYFNQLKKVMPELELLRSKNAELTKQHDQDQKLLSNLEEIKKELSSAKDSVTHLESVVELYEKEEQTRIDQAESERAAEVAAKRKRGRENSELDYG